MRQMASAEERQLCVRPSNWSGDGMRAMARRQGVPCAPGPASRCGCLLRYFHPLHALKPLVASWAAAKDSGLWPSVAGANGL